MKRAIFFERFLNFMALFFSCLDFNLNKYVVAGEKLRMQWEKAAPVSTKIFFKISYLFFACKNVSLNIN